MGSDPADSDNSDTDADAGTTLNVVEVSFNGTDFNGISNGSVVVPDSGSVFINGTRGTLEIQADGIYEYVVNETVADELDAGDTETDRFTYTISDGTVIAGTELVYYNIPNTPGTASPATTTGAGITAGDFTANGAANISSSTNVAFVLGGDTPIIRMTP